jgi:SGT1 protein
VAGFADGSAPPMHRARATLPAPLAALLAREPQLVAPAVDAFYNRDLAAMQASTTLVIGLHPGNWQMNPTATLPWSDTTLLHVVQWAAHHVTD